MPLLLLDLGMQNRCIYDIVKAKPNLRHDPELSQLYQRDKDIRRDVRVADENYVRQSILDPYSQLVQGYGEQMTVYNPMLPEEQINGIIAFLKSLQ